MIALGTTILDGPRNTKRPREALALIPRHPTRTIDAAEVTPPRHGRWYSLHDRRAAETIAATPTEPEALGRHRYLAWPCSTRLPDRLAPTSTRPTSAYTAAIAARRQPRPAKTVLAQARPSHATTASSGHESSASPSPSRGDVAPLPPHRPRGRGRRPRQRRARSPRSARITTTPPQQVLLDGEPSARTPPRPRFPPRSLVGSPRRPQYRSSRNARSRASPTSRSSRASQTIVVLCDTGKRLSTASRGTFGRAEPIRP